MQDPTQFLGSLLVALGAVGLGAGVILWRFPAAVQRGLTALPRSKWPGWLLTAAGVFWVSWVVRHAALGMFEPVKPLVPMLGLISFGAIVWFLDELLAPRALGGLLLLLANPMLNGVRWSDSPWRFVVAVIAYAWVVAGCLLMLHPWWFRKAVDRILAVPGRLRAVALGKFIGGAVLLAAGLWHLR